MYGGGRGEGKHMLPSHQQGYRTRDILFLLGTLGVAGTIATVVTGTTVIGGGGFLLLISPLLLLFSPILVPLAIFGTVVGGGGLFMATMTAMGVGSLVWFINYMRGKKPIGAESLDYVAGGVKGATEYVGDKVSHVTHSAYEGTARVLGTGGGPTCSAVAAAALAALLVLLYCLSLLAGVPLLGFSSAGCAQQQSDILLARTDADVRSSASTAGLFAELGRCEAQLSRLLGAAKARAEGQEEGEAAGRSAEPAEGGNPFEGVSAAMVEKELLELRREVARLQAENLHLESQMKERAAFSDDTVSQEALQAAEKALSQFNPPAAAAASQAATGPHAYRCAATAADMRRFFNFTPRGPCPDDWLLVQRLVFDKACHALPRRRCTAATVDEAREPMPVPEALFTQKALQDGNVRWQQHRCHSFSCLNRQSATDCRNCFNMTHEAHRWQWPYKGSIAMQDVIALKPKSLRIGLDVGGGSGTFAAHMARYGVTIMTTGLNREAAAALKHKSGQQQQQQQQQQQLAEDEAAAPGLPYMETIAARGLIPLHLPHQARLPFFDGTLDIIHSINSIKYMPPLEFEEMLFEWDRVLRPGGLLWFEMFYAPKDEMAVYVWVLQVLRYEKRYWNLMPKTDRTERKGPHVYLNCVLEKPARGSQGMDVVPPVS
ncbi:unnamed protein product [Closterium sp. Naga37s-1]|nr:unnamed protein product [Closterium sp. Naga37s-1]